MSSSLDRLPADLLSKVCGHLTPNELLVTLARTAKTTRDLLTPACFTTARSIVLGGRNQALKLLSALDPSTAGLRSFHTRVLSGCDLYVHMCGRDVSVAQVLTALDHFAACSTLTLEASFGKPLTDPQLYALLHKSVAVSCHELKLRGFIRDGTENVPVEEDEKKQPSDNRVQVKRSKKRKGGGKKQPSRTREFSWDIICLPALTSLCLYFRGERVYRGGAVFLASHTSLIELDVTTQCFSIVDLTAAFRDPSALPLLSRFSIHEPHSPQEARHGQQNVAPVLSALAKTVVTASGKPRQVEQLTLYTATPHTVIAAAARMPSLTRLQLVEADYCWLADWAERPLARGAFPKLQEFIVYAADDEELDKFGRDSITPLDYFLQSMTASPLQVLDMRQIGESVLVTTEAMQQLAAHHELRELNLRLGLKFMFDWMDWTEAGLCASWSPACFPHMRRIWLGGIKLSEEAVIAMASAAPQLQEVQFDAVALNCHPFTACSIFGAYCEHLQNLHIDDAPKHAWKDERATDVMEAYRSAVAGAGRGSDYKPFTQLRDVFVGVCSCTSPSVWHALFSLLRHATRLRAVSDITTNNPLVVCALSYLPSVTSLGGYCAWPKSFADFMVSKSESTRQFVYLASTRIKCGESCGSPESALELGEGAPLTGLMGHISLQGRDVRLRPDSHLFAAYRSAVLSRHETVLARWAAGDFQARDGQLSAAEGRMVVDDMGEDEYGQPRPLCAYPASVHSRHQVSGQDAGDTGEEAVVEPADSNNESDEEKE